MDIAKIRFYTTTGATLVKHISNIKVTRATTLSTSTSSLSFGNVTKGSNKTLNASVDYNNTTYNQQVTGECTNGMFSVTATTVGATGTGQAIPVIFKPTAVGEQSGAVTLTMNGKTVTFNVSGIGFTTYYTQAKATASTGGTAYASWTNDSFTESSTSVKNSGSVSTTSASATAYYKAVANTNYEFQGWTASNGSLGSYLSGKNATFNETYTYNSESSSSPTVKGYKAWFLPVFNFTFTANKINSSYGTANAEVATKKVLGATPDATSASTTVTFTATPNDDCTFEGWYYDEAHSNLASTSATYTPTVTNSAIGSRKDFTLYAYFKQNQTLSWTTEDFTILPTEVLDVAISSRGLPVTYSTKSGGNVISVTADGKVKGITEGTDTITVSQAGNYMYNAATSISHIFTVSKKQATFTPGWGTGDATIELDSTTTIGLTNIAEDETFRISAEPDGIISWSRSGNTLTITGVAAGVGDADGVAVLTLVQDPSATISGANTSYTINVSKHANDLAVAEESKAMKVGDVWTSVVTANTGNGNPIQVTYAPEGSESIATYNAANNKITALSEGSTSITFTQAATDTHKSATKTIAVTVTKVTNTLAVTLPSTTVETEVGNTITATIANRNNNEEGADIVATITPDSISPIHDTSYGVITYDNGVITARNAGRATIKFSQAATTKYTGYESETYTVTVSKKSNSIIITNLGTGTATNIRLKYKDTAVLAYTSTNTDTSPVVTRTSGNYTTYSSGTITAGSTAGTDIYEIRQAETYKYEAGYAQFSIRVNNTDEAVGYVLYENAKHDWGTYGEWESPTLTGPADVLTYQAYKNGYGYFFVMASKDNGANYTDIDNPDLTNDDYKTYTNQLEEDVNRVKFETRFGATLHKWMNNIFVTRKTYVRASSNKTALGTLYTDQTASATFTVRYSSTNGGNINIQSSNSHFVPSISSIPVEVNKMATAHNNVQYICGVDGTQTFTVTYTPDPDHLGADSAVVTISDLFYTQQIKLKAVARKYDTSITRDSNAATATTVGDSITNAFATFSGTTTAAPSANSNDDFYYSISSSPDDGAHNGDAVISYNPATNTITGLEAGTARLTITQKKTNLYHATSQSFDFAVTRLPNNIDIALSPTTLNVDGTATVMLTGNVSNGALSAAYKNIIYTNESQNRSGGLLSFSDNTLTAVNAGTATVTITQAETYKYVAKSQQFDVTVNKLSQTLTWDNPNLETTMQVGSTLEGNTATSSAGLTPVTYSSGNTAAITVDATTGVLTAVATGSNITITASQAGNYKYLPATLTRQLSVFNKQTPAFAADAHFTGTDGRIEYTGTATITVTGVSDGVDGDFTITNGDNTVIDVVRNGETITITGLKVGSTTLTLAQKGNDDFIAKSQIYSIEVYWPDDFLALSPATVPTHEEGDYRKIFLSRTLKAGYSTIALPFDTDVSELVAGRNEAYDSSADWVAQLSAVTSSVADGYTLYFQKVAGGVIRANEPYVLHLGYQVVNPSWTDLDDGISVEEAEAASLAPSAGYSGYTGWAMWSNFTPSFAMSGKYGIVNSEGGLKLGGNGSTLNAFTAYIAGPALPNHAPRLRVAYVDEDGTATFIDGLPEDDGVQEETVAVYGPDGQRRNRMQRGVNIVRFADGTTRKVQY